VKPIKTTLIQTYISPFRAPAILHKVPLALIVLLQIAINSEAAESYLFYKGYDYGSQANYNPLSMTLNSTLDVLQINNSTNDLTRLQLAHGFANVADNFVNPGRAIHQYGTLNFISSEVFPLGRSKDSYQYVPNYTLHLIGGGMTYVATAEWYAWHHYPAPRTLSLITMAGMHYLNEALENNSFTGPNVDPIADLMIFDPLGVVLFSSSRVSSFFAHTLNLNDWSPQTLYSPPNHQIYNNGQKFSFKYALPGVTQWRLFYLAGTEGITEPASEWN